MLLTVLTMIGGVILGGLVGMALGWLRVRPLPCSVAASLIGWALGQPSQQPLGPHAQGGGVLAVSVGLGEAAVAALSRRPGRAPSRGARLGRFRPESRLRCASRSTHGERWVALSASPPSPGSPRGLSTQSGRLRCEAREPAVEQPDAADGARRESSAAADLRVVSSGTTQHLGNESGEELGEAEMKLQRTSQPCRLSRDERGGNLPSNAL